ncbi:hypothetical protein HYX58_03905 [Candidatus Dependentiae bacterium]|nr:hypothetical protein [Candidatus Dependentiae bacterium]
MKRNQMTKHLLAGVLIGVSVFAEIGAREIRNPLPLWWGYWHYPQPRPKDVETCWNIDTWGAGYYRSAKNMFRNNETIKTENLDAVIFGLEDFLGVNAFPAGEIDPLNPFLQFSTFSPRISYNERGAFFGITVDTVFGCDCEWHIGLRATIPYRDIEMELDSCCADLEDGSLDKVCRMEREQVLSEGGISPLVQVIEDAFAYRLDFLASLRLTVNAPQEPLIKFQQPILMNQNNVTQINMVPYPVNVIAKDVGTVPTAPFTINKVVAAGLPNLAADGSGLATNSRAHFDNGTNYAPLGANLANQRRLWVLPTAAVTGGVFDIADDARNIQTAIKAIIKGLPNSSALQFFQGFGFDFNTQRTIGPGDLNLELYFQRYWCDFFGEGLLGVRAPTGKKIKNPKLLLQQSTGNNGHWEPYLGFIAGWEGLDWLHIKADGRYYYVAPAREEIAATFKGSTVKGLGPTTEADISWQYFVGDIDFTFLPVCNPRVGLDLGYQVYVKGHDHVNFVMGQLIDFLGNPALLDPAVAENRTNVTAHRIRAEIFHQSDYAEIFGGWMHTFAGKNSMKDTDWYLGMMIYF